ncbi:aldehyde dehydrogenase family protein [Phenylobacterium sp.]|uniref:aldehyde dehydrogenase family protein n=1 Tax=Phenylobacterium sp. TaxID=1871053 RepID=UPI0025E3E80B|nr:aldehyde dehydrogenase family protein [Phenylobacterium sp.]
MSTLDLAHHIGGHARPASPVLEQRNPARLDEVVARVPEATADDVGDAVAAANAALPGLSGVEARADALHAIGEALMARRSDLGLLIARETGKTVVDAQGEVMRAARLFRFFGGEALRIVGERYASVRPGVTVEVSYDPVGVVGAITPWNFPVAIPAWKIAPALAYGDAVVWKPSEHASAVAAALMEVIAGAGLPAGAVNMVLGAGGAGRALCAAPLEALSFTGSEATGRVVREAVTARGARCQAEMGGVNGLIVLADADLDAAAEAVVNGAYFAAGQRCTATSRIIVDRQVFAPLVARVGERMRALRIGDPSDPATQVGPLVSARQKSAVQDGIAAMAARGRRPVEAGRGAAAPECFVDPVLFDSMSPDDPLAQEEVFGPVAGVMVVDGYEAALETLNRVRFGLCGGLFTRSLKHAEHFKRHARVGMAMINLPTAGVDYHAPFGGMKASSYGPREQGRAAREFFTVTRTAYQAP